MKNKKLVSFLLCISVVFLFSGCSRRNVGVYSTIDANSWKLAAKDTTKYMNADDFLKETDGYVKEISQYFGVDVSDLTKSKINYFYIKNSGRSDTSFNPTIVRIADSYFFYGLAPIAHETTHAVLGKGESQSITEGIAYYMQDKISNPSNFNMGVDIDLFAKSLLDNKEDPIDINMVMDQIGKTGFPYDTDKMDKPSEYVAFVELSYSYCKYLLQNYPVKNIMQVYNQCNDETYKVAYGKDLKTLKQGWLSSLDAVPLLPKVQIYQKVVDVCKKYNYSPFIPDKYKEDKLKLD